MPIIPDKRQLKDHVNGAVAAQFWSQGIHNARSLTGQGYTAPCEPQPLRLNAPSGLSRTQFLVAAHAVRVPVFPGFCEEHGGTVVDRVLMQSGGQRWWGALLGRAKVQRGIQQRSSTRLRQNLADPNNYALAATGRLQISSSTSLKATLQCDILQQLQPLMPRGRMRQQQQQQSSSSSDNASHSSPLRHLSNVGQSTSLSMQLKQQLEGLDLTADIAVNDPSVESVRNYCITPLRVAVDLAPSGNGSVFRVKRGRGVMQGLLYRVGLHGVVAPVEDIVNPAGAAAAAPRQHALSVHCQGAIALSGSKTVWEAECKPWQAAAEDAASRHKRHKQRLRQQAQLIQQQHESADTALQPGPHPDSSSSIALAAAAVGAVGAATSTAAGHHDIDASSSSDSSSSNTKQPKQQRSSAAAASTSTRRVRINGSTAGSTSNDGSSRKRSMTLQGTEILLPLASPAAVQESLQELGSSIERLRTDLRLWTGKVQAGELQGLGMESKPPGLLAKEPGSCWSSFIPAPHFKVSGLVGLLGRIPLQQQTLLLPPVGNSSSSYHTQVPTPDRGSTAAGNISNQQEAYSQQLASSGHKARSLLASSAANFDKIVVGSARKLGRSIMQDSFLRVFGSGGASLQFGEMRGNLFDYTRLEAVVDLGLNAPETPSIAQQPFGRTHSLTRRLSSSSIKKQAGGRTCLATGVHHTSRGLGSILGPVAVQAEPTAGVAAGPADSHTQGIRGSGMSASRGEDVAASASRSGPAAATAAFKAVPTAAMASTNRQKHPAFVLEQRCVWHALTVSATQQLVGPVRLRGDWRFALDSTAPCPKGKGLLQASAPLQMLRHMAGVRPALVDAAYGLDVVVPGVGGLVRLVGWYCPARKEGGLELRLM